MHLTERRNDMNNELENARASLATAETDIKKLCDEIKEEFGKKSKPIVDEIARLMDEAGVTNNDLMHVAAPEPNKVERLISDLVVRRSGWGKLVLTHSDMPCSVYGVRCEDGDVALESEGISARLSDHGPNGIAKEAVCKLRTLATILDSLPELFSMLASEADEKRAALPDTKYARGVLDALKAIK